MALPGVRTVIKDRFYTLSRSNLPETTRVALIARRNNDPEAINSEPETIEDPENPGEFIPNPDYGPVVEDFTPLIATGEEHVIGHFGEGSELHRGYLEATAGGAARVFLISWGSTGTEPAATDADLDATGEDSPFNLAFDAAEAVQADVIVPWGRGGHPDEEGDDIPLGFQADIGSGNDSLVKRVADRCKLITDRSNPVFAVMGVTPFPGVGEIKTSDLKTHFEFPGLIERDQVSNSYVAVVATELRQSEGRSGSRIYSEHGWSNGAAHYAGFLSNLESETASTGKRLFNVRAMRYAPTRPQQISLIDQGLTPIGQNFSQEAVVVDGLTFGRPTSDFTRLSTLRIVFDAIQLVRRVAEDYVGQPATLEHRNAFDTAIGSKLRGMLIQGALVDADYDIRYAPRENRAVVDLVLTPAFEMRNIDVSISIQL